MPQAAVNLRKKCQRRLLLRYHPELLRHALRLELELQFRILVREATKPEMDCPMKRLSLLCLKSFQGERSRVVNRLVEKIQAAKIQMEKTQAERSRVAGRHLTLAYVTTC